eukprot:CAMPEP_0114555946 /NCGR_PEP_ID=MMETSP0114-20121206/9018_1 /TAXON_ID=31324 /ORGANISM="Goniomonas sp, Strain m" /LENGTH=255 /DNA_ID=CAMNT_0001741101 /DNA_START=27 /DNA_END=794 /DNA_ORIENTATION=-
MPAKKKGGKKKSKKDKGEKTATKVVEIEAAPEVVVYFRPEHWVTLRVKLVTWDYLNFDMTVPTTVRVFAVMERIREQHGGSIKEVFLYKDKVLPRNKISEMDLSLEEAGIEGGPKGSDAQCFLWYDFTPHQSNCPLLLSSPRETTKKTFPPKQRSTDRVPASRDRGDTSASAEKAKAEAAEKQAAEKQAADKAAAAQAAIAEEDEDDQEEDGDNPEKKEEAPAPAAPVTPTAAAAVTAAPVEAEPAPSTPAPEPS